MGYYYSANGISECRVSSFEEAHRFVVASTSRSALSAAATNIELKRFFDDDEDDF